MSYITKDLVSIWNEFSKQVVLEKKVKINAQIQKIGDGEIIINFASSYDYELFQKNGLIYNNILRYAIQKNGFDHLLTNTTIVSYIGLICMNRRNYDNYKPTTNNQAMNTNISTPKTTIETITPGKAREYLKLNFEANRKISVPHVYNLKIAMLKGEWIADGCDIKFNINGKLIDGQHRLEAIIRANIPVDMLVTRGLSPESAQVMDRGKTRSVADVLKLTGNTKVTKPETGVLSGMLTPIKRFTQGFNNHVNCLSKNNLYARSLSYEQKIKLTTQFLDGIQFSLKFKSTKENKISLFIDRVAVAGVIARGYYCKEINRESLTRFNELIHAQTREIKYQHENVALMCRERLLTDVQFRGSEGSDRAFAFTQYALDLFVKQDNKSRLTVPQDLTKILHKVPELDNLFL